MKKVGLVLKQCLIWIKNCLKKLFKDFKDAFLHNQIIVAKYFICISAVLNLVLSSIQIQAISKLSNQICGIVMFMFVLIGFVCLFNAIRLKEPKGGKVLFSILMLGLVIATGGYLMSIYFDALMHQKDIIASPVISAIILSIIVIAFYLFGLVETIIAYVCYRKKLKNKNKIVNA